ncbi:glycoside hydrolase family 140 protein [Thermogemmatispora sp.]|uniref:glycoside hydrolase family 140 protein n=1 Tax=Thermogemmatispora sp. TaxID=1968838 RepID=UPI0035E437DE
MTDLPFFLSRHLKRRTFVKGATAAGLSFAAHGWHGWRRPRQALATNVSQAASSRLPRIGVSDDGHFLMTEDQQPFFWLADTAWELLHRLTRSDIEAYLNVRSQQGFNVVQTVILAENDGLHQPNREGQLPLINDDPTRPNEAYFQFVDAFVERAQDYGLYVGLLPTWGDKVNQLWGVGPVVFNQNNAYSYGRFLGERYRNATNILWILGGDRPADGYEAVWRNMAAGIRDGVGGAVFMTYHPTGGQSSSQWFQSDSWLTMNMLQSGHSARDLPNWGMIAHDYGLTPVKPVLDGENNYEDHPVNWNPSNGYFSDYEVRRQAYRAVFAGACGHTYGNHSVWQCFQPGYGPISYAIFYWYRVLDHPGAVQMRYLRNLMLSRPYFGRVPDQSLVLSGEGDGPFHVQATRATDGSYAFVYIPDPVRRVVIDVSKIAGPVAHAWWYDPRTGQASEIGSVSTGGEQSFTTPGDGPDWILVLDEQARAFPAPGDLRQGGQA